jgi:hypothetical protein
VFTIPQAPWHVDHFERTMAAPLLRSGAMRTAPLGESTIYLASARAMADISVAVNRANPLVSLGRGGACRCFYCHALRLGAARENGPAEGGSLMQNLRKDGRGGTRPSRNPRKSPAFANGGPASTPAAGVLQEARGGKGA